MRLLFMVAGRTLPSMVVLTLAFLLCLAVAAPFFGYDSRVVDAERPVGWWPGSVVSAAAKRPVVTARRTSAEHSRRRWPLRAIG
ncbi:MAG: hypothetical protein KGN00_07690 [Chloroflexota bacterium]|nr:hypothetical protein [Chloroflexota bacterium]